MPSRIRTGRPVRWPGRAVLATLVVLAAVVVTGCGGGAAGGIRTSGAWARTSPMTAGAGAAYVVIDNTGSAADALVGARSTIARSTEIHETYEVEAPAASGMGSSPMLGMRRVERVEIPAGGTLELRPGSYHVMLIGLSEPLVAGARVEIVLRFERAGEVTITAEVREG